MRAGAVAPAGRSLLARYPDLLCRPPTRPLERDEVVIAGPLGVVPRPQLVKRLDLEPVLAQQPDPIRVRDVVLDAEVTGPRDAVHPELRTQQSIARDAGPVGEAECDEHRVREEDEPPAGPKQPRRLRDPLGGIGPERR